MVTMLLLLAGVIEARLTYWQVVRHLQLSQDAQAQYREVVVLPPARGAIFDRNMTQLVVNTAVYSVFVSPDQVPTDSRDHVAIQLAQVLGVDPVAVKATLSSGNKFAYIARRQPKAKADQLTAMKLPGVGLEPDQQRSYLQGITPDSSLAANLLGFVTDDGAGQSGLEAYYQSSLQGTPGFISSYRDLANREIVLGTHSHKDPVNGSDLVLSLDANIQYVAEQEIANGVQAAHAESGSVLIMDPQTGGIVAWADYPSFNGNNYVHTDPALFTDNVVSYVYEPGSVMKTVTLAGAIDSGAIKPTDIINDPGMLRIGGYNIYDFDHAAKGNITYQTVLDKSFNVGAMKAMLAEGHSNFYHYLQAFGLTAPSHIDCAAEDAVSPPPAAQMGDSQYATAAFGEGIAVNMVQMLAAVNVIANGGKYAPPHVVERVGTSVSPLLVQPQRQVISPATAKTMTAMMEDVVQHGSGWTTRVKGFELDQAAKTGTSQIPVNGQYTDQLWSSEVGFLPADHPRFTMLVVIRKPHNPTIVENDGYFVAGPVFQKIAQAMVVNWRITPDQR